MSGKLLIDTVALSDPMAGVERIFAALPADAEFVVPFVAVGKMHYAIRNSRDRKLNSERFDEILRGCEILQSGPRTAEVYGELRYKLKQLGTPIPQNDLWIASLAVEHSLPVVTLDAHFNNIPGLQIVRW